MAFICNGMLDQRDRLWPDFHLMIKTLGYKLSDDVKHLILDNFNLLYKTVSDFGCISEKIFNSLGFPHDRSSSGEAVYHDYEISME
eukprot:950522-Ditylum_brightwellii.AAC.1